MELDAVVERLLNLLAPILSYLMREGLPDDIHLDTYSVYAARRAWALLTPAMDRHEELKRSLEAFSTAPEEEDRRRAFGLEIKRLLLADSGISGEIRSILTNMKTAGLSEKTPRPNGFAPSGEGSQWFHRVEMLKLLRFGVEPKRIAERFGVSVEDVWRVNYDFSIGGVASAVAQEGLPPWFDQLDGSDPVLRRLEMVRLVRVGTPPSVVAHQFHALEDYVVLLGQRFAEHGLPGIMTEDDIERFQSVNPREIRICSYNLQGVRSNGLFRYRRMARELSRYRPDLIAFQEVVSGAGVEDTGGQVARWLSSITGEHYRSHFTYCHQFMDKYPEGVAVCTRRPAEMIAIIDLTTNLRKGLRPSMDRRAQVAETLFRGKKVILVSTHLDHVGSGEVRLAQAEKLVSELDRLTARGDYYALIIAGDLNDNEDSPALRFLKNAGYKDSYRMCHNEGGNTFPVPRAKARIDYILVKGQAHIVSAEVILNNPDFSDHLGVFAVVK